MIYEGASWQCSPAQPLHQSVVAAVAAIKVATAHTGKPHLHAVLAMRLFLY
eukprot:COSAG02_NODE_63203_length_264_cov_0.315152_2_plen_50_part_01